MKNIVLAACLVFSLSSYAQKVSNNLQFEKGKKLELIYKANSTSTSMGETKMDVNITRSFDVEDVVNGNAVIEHKIKRIQFNVESMMGNEKFDSEKEADRKGDIGKALEKTLKNKYTMTLDATGRVVSVKQDDTDKDKQPTPEDRMLLGMIEGIAGKIGAPEVGETSLFSILPAREVAVGETWLDTTATRSTQYTIRNITDDEIVVGYTETLNNEQKQEVNGMTITIVSADKTSGDIRIDRKTGLLKEKTATTTSEGSMSVMGQSMPMNSTSTKTWTLK